MSGSQLTKVVEIEAVINIALVKYWGKLHEELNIPWNSSVSVSLGKELKTKTQLQLSAKSQDDFILRTPNRIIDLSQNKKYKLIKN